MKENIKKTLIYNLVLFDFILLEVSTNKISNFFIEKLKNSNFFLRFSVFDIVKSFKQFIKLFTFIKKNIKKKQKNIIYFWVNSDYAIDFFKFFFKKYKSTFDTNYSLLFPNITTNLFLPTTIIINNLISKNQFYSFFFKNLWLIQSINILHKKNLQIYNLFADFNDYKKFIFLGLLLNSIFNAK